MIVWEQPPPLLTNACDFVIFAKSSLQLQHLVLSFQRQKCSVQGATCLDPTAWGLTDSPLSACAPILQSRFISVVEDKVDCFYNLQAGKMQSTLDQVPAPTTACNLSSSSDTLFLASKGIHTHIQIHIVRNNFFFKVQHYSPPSPSKQAVGLHYKCVEKQDYYRNERLERWLRG